MTVGGGFEQRGVGRGLRWPRDRRREEEKDGWLPPTGYGFQDLLERRPELNDMIMPRVREVFTEGV